MFEFAVVFDFHLSITQADKRRFNRTFLSSMKNCGCGACSQIINLVGGKFAKRLEGKL